MGPKKQKAYIEGLDIGTIYRWIVIIICVYWLSDLHLLVAVLFALSCRLPLCLHRITVRVVYTVGESKDSNSVVASLDTGTTQSSHAGVARDGLDHSNETESDPGAHFPNASSGQHFDNSNIPEFQAPLRLSPGESASNPVVHLNNNTAQEQLESRRHRTGEDSAPHQSSGMTETTSLEDCSSEHRFPRIALGGDGSDGDAYDSVGDVQLFITQEQQLELLKLEGNKQDKPPGLMLDPKLCRSSPGNTPDFSVSGVGAEPVDCFYSAQSAEHGLVEHKPTGENMSTGNPHGATTASLPPLGPSLTISPHDAPLTWTTGASLAPTACPLISGKLMRFWDDGDALPQQPSFQHKPAIPFDGLTYCETKQVPASTSEDSSCVTVNKTQEQRLLDCDDAFLVGSNEHGTCLLSTAASTVGMRVANSMDSDWMQSTGCDSAPRPSPSGVDTARETSSEQIFGSSGSYECLVTTVPHTTSTHNNKQELGQRGNFSANASVCELEQTNTSGTSSKICFDPAQESLGQPKEDSDSIIPLGETALTMPTVSSSDNRLSTGPLVQTMQLDVTMDKPLIIHPLIFEGDGQGPRENEVEHAGGSTEGESTALTVPDLTSDQQNV